MVIENDIADKEDPHEERFNGLTKVLEDYKLKDTYGTVSANVDL